MIADIAVIARDRKIKNLTTDSTLMTLIRKMIRTERSETWNVWRRIERFLPA